MAPQIIIPTFDPACRRIFHADRRGAHAQLVAMEIWNRATGRDLGPRALKVYRCVRCGGYHVAARMKPSRTIAAQACPPMDAPRQLAM